MYIKQTTKKIWLQYIVISRYCNITIFQTYFSSHFINRSAWLYNNSLTAVFIALGRRVFKQSSKTLRTQSLCIIYNTSENNIWYYLTSVIISLCAQCSQVTDDTERTHFLPLNVCMQNPFTLFSRVFPQHHQKWISHASMT